MNQIKIRIKRSKLLLILILPIILITITSSLLLVFYANALEEESVSVSDEVQTCLSNSDCSENELCISSNLGMVCEEVPCDQSTICPTNTICIFDTDADQGFCKLSDADILGISDQRPIDHTKRDISMVFLLSLAAISLFVFIDAKNNTFKKLFIK